MKYKPGESCPKTCVCNMCDKDGKVMGTVEMQKGQSFPPTPHEDCYYTV